MQCAQLEACRACGMWTLWTFWTLNSVVNSVEKVQKPTCIVHIKQTTHSRPFIGSFNVVYAQIIWLLWVSVSVGLCMCFTIRANCGYACCLDIYYRVRSVWFTWRSIVRCRATNDRILIDAYVCMQPNKNTNSWGEKKNYFFSVFRWLFLDTQIPFRHVFIWYSLTWWQRAVIFIFNC